MEWLLPQVHTMTSTLACQSSCSGTAGTHCITTATNFISHRIRTFRKHCANPMKGLHHFIKNIIDVLRFTLDKYEICSYSFFLQLKLASFLDEESDLPIRMSIDQLAQGNLRLQTMKISAMPITQCNGHKPRPEHISSIGWLNKHVTVRSAEPQSPVVRSASDPPCPHRLAVVAGWNIQSRPRRSIGGLGTYG